MVGVWLKLAHYIVTAFVGICTLSFKLCIPAAGTRIIYDRKFLLDRRNSPIAQTPPAHLPVIPGVTSKNVVRENQKNDANNHINKHDDKPANGMHSGAIECDRPPAIIV